MADNITKIGEEFKELMELKIQNQAQFKVITNLTKTNQELHEKIKSLEGMLNKTIPIISPMMSLSPVPNVDGDSEILISKMEIEKLRIKSTIELLTYEDARKLELYTKILNNFRNKPKTIDIKVKELTEEQLMSTLNESSNE